MKIKIVAIILVLVICLSSCDNMTVNNKPEGGGSVLLSVEIQESQVRHPNRFALRVGLGNLSYYLPHATTKVSVSSPDLVIIAPDGSKHNNQYVCEYTDFGSEKYTTYLDSDRKYTCRYFETYLFGFEEAPENHSGKISFEICAEIDETQAPAGYSGLQMKRVYVHYKVRNGKIRVYTKIDHTTNFLMFLDKICKVFDR